ncbi:MAG: hypothetical protein JXQ97_05925 [Natronospirillum sp.]
MIFDTQTALRLSGLLVVCVGLTACLPEEDSPQRNTGDDDRFRSILVDASDNTTFRGVNLVTGETTKELDGDDWHIALRRYNGVQMNGGVVGSGSVSAALADEQEAFYDGAGDPIANTFINATPEMYVADLEYPYDPVDLTFSAEEKGYAFGLPFSFANYGRPGTKWWEYRTADGFVVGNVDANWVVKSTGGSHFAVKVTTDTIWQTRESIFNGITLNVVTANADGEFTGTGSTLQGGAGGAAYFDLDTGAVESSIADAPEWDIAFIKEGSDLRLELNGGVTANGGVVGQGPFTTTEVDALSVDSNFDRGNVSDGVSNIFTENEWLVYGVEGYGTGHSLAPNFRVFAVDLDGDSATTDDIYMVQAVNYYHPDAGTSGHITLRVRQLD